MTELLCKIFIKDREKTNDVHVRKAYGTLSCTVGIVINTLLALFKIFAGVITASVAVSADGINNLSDASAQVISLISFKISSKPADRKHPFGHARIEYVTSMIVSFIILTVAIELLQVSISRIIHPTDITFGLLPAIILFISVLAKLWLALFNKKISKKIDSSVNRAASADSISDALSSFAVLVSMIVAHSTGIHIDGYMGLVVSIVIFIAGIKILNDTKNSILGCAPSEETVDSIKNIALSHKEILGVHDLMVHSYGPGRTIASMDVEVDGNSNVFYTHAIIDGIEREIFKKLNVEATIHMDPVDVGDVRTTKILQSLMSELDRLDMELTVHDFRVSDEGSHTNLIFDVCAPYELKIDDSEIKRQVSNAVSFINPNYFALITIDRR